MKNFKKLSLTGAYFILKMNKSRLGLVDFCLKAKHLSQTSRFHNLSENDFLRRIFLFVMLNKF